MIAKQYDQVLEENDSPMNLVASIETNAKHYLDLMARAVDKVMPDATREIKYVIYLLPSELRADICV
jgi:DNA replication licensing factor MCM7